MSEINLSKLANYDFIVMIDTSGSMEDTVKEGSDVTRWEHVQETAIQFSRDLSKIDSDGIGLVTFGGNIESFDGVNADKVKEVFASLAPRGTTPLAEALLEALKLANKSDKKDFIVCFTDGVPDNRKAAEAVIRDAANAIETDDALTILFIQIGDDARATAYLKQLDDDLKGAKFDIVDTKTIEEAGKFRSTSELILYAMEN